MSAASPGPDPGARRTVLVTGATGFIGSRLCSRLSAAGRSVVGCARTGGSGFTRADVTDTEGFSAVVRACAPAVIVHLASVGVAPAQAQDQAVIPANVAMADTVVRAAAQIPGCRVIHAGSMAEYGAHPHPLHEDCAPAPGPHFTSYAVAKLAAGLHARSQGRRLGVPVVVARLFGVYGPGEASHRLFPSLLAGLRAGRPIDLSDGRQRRDFVHVDDACEALLRLADLPAEDLLVNVGTGVAVEVAVVCRGLARALDADEGLLRFGARARSPGDADLLVADTTRLGGLLGWVPPARLSARDYDLDWFA